MKKFKDIRKSTRKKIFTLGGMLIAFVVLQTLLSLGLISNQINGWLIPICYNIILAVSLNLTVGILGELSLGHAGFMCVGAFVGAFVSKYMVTVNPEVNDFLRIGVAILVGGAVAGIFGLLIGIPVLRLQGDYLAIVTLAFGEIIWNVFNVMRVALDENGLHFQLGGTGFTDLSPDAEQLVKGSLGITKFGKLPKDTGFAIAFALTFITVIVVLNFIHSRTGRAVKAIRDNQIAAESVGINIKKYKLIVLVVSAFFAGIAGVLYSHNSGQAIANVNDYGYIMSINILVFVVLGGMSSTLGSMIAAIVLTILPDWLRFLSDYRMLIYAVVLIGMMLFRSNPTLKGFVDMVKKKIKAFFGGVFKKSSKEA
ncbi:MAG: branched-chain amino acid ABC transporter permease [Oscillospiraceae bacterium]